VVIQLALPAWNAETLVSRSSPFKRGSRVLHPKGRILSPFFCAAAIASGAAMAEEPLLQALRECAMIAESAPRLACFDTVAAKQSRSPPPVSTPSQSPDAVTDQSRAFGLGSRDLKQARAREGVDEPRKIDRVEARISAIRQRAGGLSEFVLDNGQIWQQTESELTATLKVDDAVTITHGALGSFWISTGSKTAIRAKRIQ
jgi:hypothetical protein